MTALVDRLEQLHARATPGPWLSDATDTEEHYPYFELDGVPWDIGFTRPNAALIVVLRNALPALLTALRAAERVTNNPAGWTIHQDRRVAELKTALAPLFGENTTP